MTDGYIYKKAKYNFISLCLCLTLSVMPRSHLNQLHGRVKKNVLVSWAKIYIQEQRRCL